MTPRAARPSTALSTVYVLTCDYCEGTEAARKKDRYFSAWALHYRGWHVDGTKGNTRAKCSRCAARWGREDYNGISNIRWRLAPVYEINCHSCGRREMQTTVRKKKINADLKNAGWVALKANDGVTALCPECANAEVRL